MLRDGAHFTVADGGDSLPEDDGSPPEDDDSPADDNGSPLDDHCSPSHRDRLLADGNGFSSSIADSPA